MGPPPCTSLLPRCLSSLAAPVLITHSSLITRSFRHPEASVLVPLVDPLSGAAWPRDVPTGERGCPLALSVPFCIHGGSRCPHGSFTTAVFFLPAPSAPIYRGFAACEAACSQTGGLLGSLLRAGMLRPQHKPASCPRAPATAHGAGGDLAAPSPPAPAAAASSGGGDPGAGGRAGSPAAGARHGSISSLYSRSNCSDGDLGQLPSLSRHGNESRSLKDKWLIKKQCCIAGFFIPPTAASAEAVPRAHSPQRWEKELSGSRCRCQN